MSNVLIGIIGDGTDANARAVCKESEKQFSNPDPETGIAALSTTANWETRVNQRRSGGCLLYTAIMTARPGHFVPGHSLTRVNHDE